MAVISDKKVSRIRKMYTEEMMSMREIAEKLNVHINAVTYIMRKHNIGRRNPSEANAVVFKNKPASFSLHTGREAKEKELDIVGAMLYWAEGYKTDKASGIDFANSDPFMIKAFMNFMHSRYRFDHTRIRGHLFCYDNQDSKELIEFWSELTGIQKGNFIKPYITKSTNFNGRKMKYGVLHIKYADKKLLKDMLNLIDYYKSRFGQI